MRWKRPERKERFNLGLPSSLLANAGTGGKKRVVDAEQIPKRQSSGLARQHQSDNADETET